MERSLPGRIGAPLGLPRLRRGRRSSGPGAVGRLRGTLAPLWRPRGTRIALLAVLVAVALLWGGFMLLRHSSFVAVQQVRVSGVQGPEAHAIEGALVAAARHMSTLDVRTEPLRAAVAPFRVVASIRAVASFPHGLQIEVGEQLPVAALLVNGARTAVAADGVVLGPALLSGSLPTLTGYLEPPAGAQLHSPFLLESLTVLGAAPHALAKRVARVYIAPQGLTVAMSNGLLAYFGDDTRPHAKWLSLARVLADHSSAGASYVDVRLPARPAAGFPAGAGPASTTTGGAEPSGAGAPASAESAVGALAAGLSKEGGKSPTGATGASPSTSGEPSTSTSGAPAEGSGESSATPSASGEASAGSSGSSSTSTQEAPAPGG